VYVLFSVDPKPNPKTVVLVPFDWKFDVGSKFIGEVENSVDKYSVDETVAEVWDRISPPCNVAALLSVEELKFDLSTWKNKVKVMYEPKYLAFQKISSVI
jgi:hypothetical protein